MKLSTKSRYALRLLVDLAERRGEGFIALKDIARRQEISKKYLEQIVNILGQAGMLSSTRGFQGGYSLARAPSEITVGDVLRATEGGLAFIECVGCPGGCDRSGNCPTLPVWKGLQKVIDDYVDGITLQDIADQQRQSWGNDYVI